MSLSKLQGELYNQFEVYKDLINSVGCNVEILWHCLWSDNKSPSLIFLIYY